MTSFLLCVFYGRLFDIIGFQLPFGQSESRNILQPGECLRIADRCTLCCLWSLEKTSPGKIAAENYGEIYRGKLPSSGCWT